jgi:dTMP kinase
VPGLLVVLEGPEGSGKSTHAARLRDRLAAAGVAHLLLREPGGTPLSEEIRQILLDPMRSITAEAECLLFLAARAELVRKVLRPALAEGRVVLLDRFFLSTYAYQIRGRGLPEAFVRSGNDMAADRIKPDITLLLSVAAEEGLRRAASRGGSDRMEMSGQDFHRRVAQAFREFGTDDWQREHPECGEIVTIDATQPQNVVADAVNVELERRFPAFFGGVLRA